MQACAYYPGCALSGTGVPYDESLRELLRVLGIPVAGMQDWNCCGATSYTAIDETSAFLLSARNLAIARQMGAKEMLAPCAACYLVLRKTQNYAHNYPAIGRRISEDLQSAGLPPLDSVAVRHPLEMLYTDVGLERIRAKAVRSWRGGEVACYYGCQLVRPLGEADSPHDPCRMDELLRAVGVPAVDYALKTKCCGGSLTGTMHDIGLRLNYILLKEAERKGAMAIVTACPLCQLNLDMYQSEIRRQSSHPLDMPVLYFTQVLGWALGGEPAALGLRRLISGRSLIRQWFPARHKEAAAYV